uniref:Uncharacterized protein n=1 Tax=Heterorhabditis bacteriophora TaxID=37862 RepID=A0A1I7WV81_HETBA
MRQNFPSQIWFGGGRLSSCSRRASILFRASRDVVI